MGVERIITSLHQEPGAQRRVMIGLFPLFFASLVYGAAMRLRQWCYRVGIFRVKRLDAAVVCVGNITTGGTGKTPAVIHIARRLKEMGITTAVISRGYGYRIPGSHLVVSDANGPCREMGQAPDEALMTALKLPGIPVVVSPDRYRAGSVAVERFGAEVVVMDDGFQHLGLLRDLDVLVVDADNPVGNGLVLPAGPLREPVSGAQRAHAVWLSGSKEARLTGALETALEDKPVIRARMAPGRFVTQTGEDIPVERLSGTPVCAFAGIARPGRFFETLDGLGVVTADRASFGDHHRYTGDDVDRLNRRTRQSGASMMVTTEKDLARLPSDTRFLLPVAALVMDLEVSGDDVLIRMITERIRDRKR